MLVYEFDEFEFKYYVTLYQLLTQMSNPRKKLAESH